MKAACQGCGAPQEYGRIRCTSCGKPLVFPTDEAPVKIAEATRDAARRGMLSMWTVYEKPTDHPDGYVVRRFDCTAEGPVATHDAYVGELEAIRDALWEAGLIRMPRRSDDEPQIVETWL